MKCSCSFSSTNNGGWCNRQRADDYFFPVPLDASIEARCNIDCWSHSKADGLLTKSCSTKEQSDTKLVQTIEFGASGHRSGASTGCQGSGVTFAPEYHSALNLPGAPATDQYDVTFDIVGENTANDGRCYLQVDDEGVPTRQAIDKLAVQLHLPKMKAQNASVSIMCTAFATGVSSFGGHGEELRGHGGFTLTVVAKKL